MEILILSGFFILLVIFIFTILPIFYYEDQCSKKGEHSWKVYKEGKFTKLFTNSVVGGVYSYIGREVKCQKCKEVRKDDGEHQIDWYNEIN